MSKVSSDKYLAVLPEQDYEGQPVLGMLEEPEPATEFLLHPASFQQGEAVSIEASVQLQHAITGMWLHAILPVEASPMHGTSTGPAGAWDGAASSS